MDGVFQPSAGTPFFREMDSAYAEIHAGERISLWLRYCALLLWPRESPTGRRVRQRQVGQSEGIESKVYGSSAYGVCEVIRKRSQVPIIMLTALSDEENQLRGFEQQIDDYIPKPFSPKILLCKIAAILRRRTVENQNQSLLTYKELSMDVDGFHVYQGGNEVVLTSKEFALLRLMLENQGKVFTRQMLLDRLWADDLEVEDRIVDSHIKNIRKKLNADYIKTIRGVGYRIDKEN